MLVVTTIKELQQVLSPYRSDNQTIGFVPTMGALHAGHQSLFSVARDHHDVVVVSIFVNPLQFGPGEDYETYPRQQALDEQVARESGCDVLFCPTVGEMYPDGFPQVVHVKQGADVMCGRSRPGHFDGVATVVLKLFSVVQPNEAFFGEKDAQQLAIIKQLVKEFFLPITVTGCPTVREEDGLARSSRNVYLTAEERRYAPLLYKALQKAQASGKRDPSILVADVKATLASIPVGEIDYVEAYEYPSLKKVNEANALIIVAFAYQFKKARLIDHIVMDFNNRGETPCSEQ
ncbi:MULTISPECIES: pantoate--beta-alanine ligase [Shouchella]|uniref:Pantothenate synthetase n=1 Tax=Shouchella hunanensis TaxID=766894 RepID=A0ABY7W4L1_9BACI|nr:MULTISPECIES: pantoate--beta-alanine ligase [Shouchella]WDF03531.1 pantoate--beta-alanine ligase [Shouchella hunanensis]GAF24194.1 pantoate--beta-alanine ligase [Bacillus sp. JCM 19047]